MAVLLSSPPKQTKGIKMITIERLKEYSETDAADIGRLMAILTEKADGQPINEQLLRNIIESPWHEQFAARDENGRVVGTATLSEILGPFVGGYGRTAYLEDLVVDPEIRGAGIGSRLWDEMLVWCRERGLKRMEFTSNPRRQAVYDFYLKRGAKVRDTAFFRLEID
jgi:GNAT superfamily N-acetyltransferase